MTAKTLTVHTFLILFFIGFMILVILGVKESEEQSDKCRAKGGVAVTERGIYKSCVRPENFIKLED